MYPTKNFEETDFQSDLDRKLNLQELNWTSNPFCFSFFTVIVVNIIVSVQLIYDLVPLPKPGPRIKPLSPWIEPTFLLLEVFLPNSL